MNTDNFAMAIAEAKRALDSASSFIVAVEDGEGVFFRMNVRKDACEEMMLLSVVLTHMASALHQGRDVRDAIAEVTRLLANDD